MKVVIKPYRVSLPIKMDFRFRQTELTTASSTIKKFPKTATPKRQKNEYSMNNVKMYACNLCN